MISIATKLKVKRIASLKNNLKARYIKVVWNTELHSTLQI